MPYDYMRRDSKLFLDKPVEMGWFDRHPIISVFIFVSVLTIIVL